MYTRWIWVSVLRRPGALNAKRPWYSHIGLTFRKSESHTGSSYYMIATDEYRSNPKAPLRIKRIPAFGPHISFFFWSYCATVPIYPLLLLAAKCMHACCFNSASERSPAGIASNPMPSYDDYKSLMLRTSGKDPDSEILLIISYGEASSWHGSKPSPTQCFRTKI